MRRVLSSLVFAIFAAGVSIVALASEQGDSQLFSKPVVMRGSLGGDQVQLNVRPKTVDEGIEGDYFIFGTTLRILLAGEVEDSDVMMEESENGTDVSGQWIGTLDGDTFSGEWQSADGTVTKRFALKAVQVQNAFKTH